MIILQILLAAGTLGIFGFAFYWFAVLFGAAPKKTQDDINKNPPQI